MARTFITASLLTLSVSSCFAQTFTIQFGDAGGLVIEYEVTTTQQYRGLNFFKNRVSGKITNTTELFIDCVDLEPVVKGQFSTPLTLHLIGVHLPAGSSKSFSLEEGASTTDIGAKGITAWKGACTTWLDYEFVQKSATKDFPSGVVTGTIGPTNIGITVENNSDQPLEIVWNDCSFIDMTRSAKRIFHSGVKYADREQSLPNTMVPPHAKAEDTAVPTANVRFSGGEYGGWREEPLLPMRVPPDLAAKTIKNMKGAKLELFLQLLVSGKKVPVSLVFEVFDVKPQLR